MLAGITPHKLLCVILASTLEPSLLVCPQALSPAPGCPTVRTGSTAEGLTAPGVGDTHASPPPPVQLLLHHVMCHRPLTPVLPQGSTHFLLSRGHPVSGRGPGTPSELHLSFLKGDNQQLPCGTRHGQTNTNDAVSCVLLKSTF